MAAAESEAMAGVEAEATVVAEFAVEATVLCGCAALCCAVQQATVL